MMKIEFEKSLGEGSFGSVDLMKFTNPDGSNPHYHAVKSSYLLHHKSLLKEFEILSKLRDCPRIIQTFGTGLSTGVDKDGIRVYKMAMEYASAGNLTSFMGSRRSLPDSMIKNFTHMILEGLVSIHKLGYVHCDLKPDNLLVFPRLSSDASKISYELKISDFGMATEIGEDSEFWDFDYSPFLGTPPYMSPDSVHNGFADESLDLWSLGCIVLEMYTGESPWPFQYLKELLPVLLNGNAPQIPEFIPCDASQFILKCFARKTTALELLNHPFLHQKTVSSGENRESRKVAEKPLKVKIIPPKAVLFKKAAKKPLRFKIKPPGLEIVLAQ